MLPPNLPTPEDIDRALNAAPFSREQAFCVTLHDEQGRTWFALLVAPEKGMNMPAELHVDNAVPFAEAEAKFKAALQ